MSTRLEHVRMFFVDLNPLFDPVLPIVESYMINSRTLFGYDPFYPVVVLSNDRIASIVKGKNIRVWSTEIEESFIIRGRGEVLNCVVPLSRKRLAESSTNIRIWDWSTGRCLLVLHGDGRPVKQLLASRKTILVSGSDSGSIKAWNINTGECVANYVGHRLAIHNMILVSKNRLVSSSYDRTIRIWNRGGQCIKIINDGIGNGHSLITLGGDRIASNSYNGITKIWNMKFGVCELELKTGHTIHRLESQKMVSCFDTSYVKIWDTISGVCDFTLEEGKEKALCIRIIKNKILAVGYGNGNLKTWDVNTGALLDCELGHKIATHKLTNLPSGILISCGVDETIKIWDPV